MSKVIEHTEIRKGHRIREGRKVIKVESVERWPETICRGTHVYSPDTEFPGCYMSEVTIG